MVTLRQLYTVFGHDPKWGRLATQSAQPMVSVFMRKLGDTGGNQGGELEG